MIKGRPEIAAMLLKQELKKKGALRKPDILKKVARELDMPVAQVRQELRKIIRFYAKLTRSSTEDIERDCLGVVLLMEVSNIEIFLRSYYRNQA
jgi:ribosomal protein L18E